MVTGWRSIRIKSEQYDLLNQMKSYEGEPFYSVIDRLIRNQSCSESNNTIYEIYKVLAEINTKLNTVLQMLSKLERLQTSKLDRFVKR